MIQNFTKFHIQHPYAVLIKRFLLDQTNFKLLLSWQQKNKHNGKLPQKRLFGHTIQYVSRINKM